MGIRNDSMLQASGWIVITLLVVGIVGGLCLLLAWPFMWIWNYAVVSALAVAKPITYWPAFWLSVFIGAFLGRNAASKSNS